MKGFKARLLKTLKSFPHVGGHQKTGRVFVDVADGIPADEYYEATPLHLHAPPRLQQATSKPTYSRTLSTLAPPTAHLTPTLSEQEELVRHSVADPFLGFELRSPPGGKDCVILYTTSLRGIRKTFEECSRVRLLLDNLGVAFQERDISMDKGYRDEMWRVLGWRAVPPRLFVKGRYVGGADDAVALHEQGRLVPMLPPADPGKKPRCAGCGGLRFVVCEDCDGSRKLYYDDTEETVQCPSCNENGLIPCPACLD